MDMAKEKLQVPRKIIKKKKKKLYVISWSQNLFVGEDSQGAADWSE